MELFNKTPSEMLELMKSEIKKITEMKTPILNEQAFIEDDIMFYDEVEIIKYIKEKTIKENWDLARTVGPYKINVEKLETYPNLIDCRTGKHKPRYAEYIKEVTNQLKKHEDLIQILKEPNIKISLYFFVNYNQKDLDNLSNAMKEAINLNFDKSIIDMLYFSTSKDDISLRKYYSEVWKNEQDSSEYFIIEVERQKHSEYHRCDVLSRLMNKPPL